MSSSIVRIGRAATGLGLFAAKPIAAKAYIVTYQGRRIPTAEAQRRERDGKAKFMFEINRQWTIDGSSRRNLGRYINHAVEIADGAAPSAHHMVVVIGARVEQDCPRAGRNADYLTKLLEQFQRRINRGSRHAREALGELAEDLLCGCMAVELSDQLGDGQSLRGHTPPARPERPDQPRIDALIH